MADINLKTLSPDASLPTDGFLFGADSQAAASPSVYSTQTVATTLLGSTSLSGSTVTTSQPVLNLSQTWNAGAVAFTGLSFNVTDTASAAGSLLLDLQVGGSRRFQVTSAGTIVVGQGAGAGTIGSGGGGSIQLASGAFQFSGLGAMSISNAAGQISIGVSLGTQDLFLRRVGAATLQLGAADAAAPVAQTLQVQSVVAGTTNTAGANFTIKGSAGTGTGAGGSIIFQITRAGSSGTSQNAYETAVTIDATRNLNCVGAIFAQGASGNNNAQMGSFNAITMASSGYFGIGPNVATTGNDADTRLYRDAANTLALRNGTSAQTLRVYNAAGATPSADYDLGTFDFSTTANVLTIGTRNGGAYATARAVQFVMGGTNIFNINTSGHLLWNTNNTYDIGSSGGSSPRNIYASTGVWAQGTGNLGFWGRAAFTAPSGGNDLTLNNSSYNGFGRLQFGGTTSSYPSLQRSGASLICRLADDSANAAFEALSLKTAAPTGGTSGTWKVGVYNATAPSATGYVEVDIGGTLYKLLAAT